MESELSQCENPESSITLVLTYVYAYNELHRAKDGPSVTTTFTCIIVHAHVFH